MNIKLILNGGLIVTLLLSMAVYGFLYYNLSNDTTEQTGKQLVQKHKLYFYIHLGMQFVLLGIAGAVLYKK